MKLAAIDLGSNTVKLAVARADAPTRSLDVFFERADVTRLGEGLDRHGALLPEAMARTLAVLKAQVTEARSLGAERIQCVGTAGLRGAANAHEFLRRAHEEAGVTIEVIDGHREAALAYRAPAAMFGPAPLIVVDIGGRSTEIISGRGPTVDGLASLEIGGVRLTERFLPSDPPTQDQREALEAYVRVSMGTAPPAPSDAVVVGVSGTVLSLFGLHLNLDDMAETIRRADGAWLPRDAVASLCDVLAAIPAQERQRGTVLPAGRADVIVAGATVLLGILDHYRCLRMRVTHRGVRFGLLSEMADRDKMRE